MTDSKKHNLDMNKLRMSAYTFEDHMQEQLQDEEYQKGYLTVVLEEYLKDGDFRPFFRALERVVKARGSVTSFCENAGVERTNFYKLLNGKRKPQLETVLKIVQGLGFSLKVG